MLDQEILRPVEGSELNGIGCKLVELSYNQNTGQINYKRIGH